MRQRRRLVRVEYRLMYKPLLTLIKDLELTDHALG